jgi:UDP-N-acetylglucosamine diphosphorylase/glucosamine-1-phosphate N-acetyltransferase
MMQAVILAGGKSTRTYPLTVNMHKDVLPVLDKTVIERTLDELKGLVDEVIIVVGHLKEQVIDAVGDSYEGLHVKYAVQGEHLGTGDALMAAKGLIRDRFIMLNGDDLYSGNDLKRCISHKYCVLAQRVEDPSRFGVLRIDGKYVKEIVEKPTEYVSDLANCGGYVLDKKIFDFKLSKTKRGEYEATDYINELAKTEKIEYEEVKDYWIAIGYPWHLLEANIFFLKRMKEFKREGEIEKGATVKGNVHIGKGTVIKSGSYVEGPAWIGENCVIGPHAYIRPDSIILDNCHVRSEVYDALIMEGATAKHFSYIAHSVIGRNCNIGAGTITADYRHDSGTNVTLINEEKVDSGRTKLGAFMGDNVRTGINTAIYPGRKLWPEQTTLPGEIVKKDIIQGREYVRHHRHRGQK